MLLDLTDALKNQGDSRPFKISGSIPGGVLPEGMELVSPVMIEGTMTAFGHSVALVGDLRAEVSTCCALCLKPMRLKIVCEYNELLRRLGYQGDQVEDDEIGDEDSDAVEFEGSSCDLSESAGQAILMSLPMRHVCSDECRGLCPVCGADRNEKSCGCVREEDSPFAALAALIMEEE